MDVAVHAFVAGVAPVGDGVLVEALQVALHDLEVVPDFEAGLDEPVGEVGIDPVRAHVEGPVPPHGRSAGAPGAFHFDVMAGGEELCPAFFFPADFPAPESHGFRSACEAGHETAAGGIGIVEIERRYVAGNGNILIFRIDETIPVGSGTRRTDFCATAGQKQKAKQQGCLNSFHF